MDHSIRVVHFASSCSVVRLCATCPNLENASGTVDYDTDLRNFLKTEHLKEIFLDFGWVNVKPGDVLPWNLVSLVEHPTITKLTMRGYPRPLDDFLTALAAIPSDSGRFSSLVFQNIPLKLSQQASMDLRISCVKELRIFQAPNGPLEDLFEFLKLFPNITTLYLEGIHLQDFSCITENLLLETLTVDSCHMDSLAGIEFCECLTDVSIFSTTGLEHMVLNERGTVRPEYLQMFPPSADVQWFTY